MKCAKFIKILNIIMVVLLSISSFAYFSNLVMLKLIMIYSSLFIIPIGFVMMIPYISCLCNKYCRCE